MWRLFSDLIEMIAGFLQRLQDGGFGLDPLAAVLLIIPLSIWIGFACWAASIAESRRHGPRRHFFLGLLIPVLYTLIIMFTMKVRPMPAEIKEAAEKAQLEAEEAEKAAETAAAEQAAEQEDVQEQEAEAFAPEFNMAYFKRVAFDDNGQPIAPWIVRFDGTDIRVEKILEVQQNLLVVEAVGREDQLQRMRLPYAKITDCQKA